MHLCIKLNRACQLPGADDRKGSARYPRAVIALWKVEALRSIRVDHYDGTISSHASNGFAHLRQRLRSLFPQLLHTTRSTHASRVVHLVP